jgi:SAM-dependent methyltransferase
LESEIFQLLKGIEASWWYRGRARAVQVAIKNAGLKSKTRCALDVGSGFGGMCDELSQLSEQVYAWEPHLETHKLLRARNYARVFDVEEEALAQTYDLVGMFDVLEHMEHDCDFLTRLRGSLAPDSHIVITVPAFPFLWSVHDELNHHYRRYTRRSLMDLLFKSGYELDFMSYWNASLFLPAAVVRILGRSSGSSALILPKRADNLLFALLRAETSVMRHIPLPFGTGLVAIARHRQSRGG